MLCQNQRYAVARIPNFTMMEHPIYRILYQSAHNDFEVYYTLSYFACSTSIYNFNKSKLTYIFVLNNLHRVLIKSIITTNMPYIL